MKYLRVRVVVAAFIFMCTTMTFAPAEVRAITVGTKCTLGAGVTGGNSCTVTRLWNSNGYPGEAKGNSLFKDSAPVAVCNSTSKPYLYIADYTYNKVGGINPTTRFTLLRWLMRFPSDFELNITTSLSDIVSGSAYFVFGGGVSRGDIKATTYNFKFAGGGTGLQTAAKIAELTIYEDWEYLQIQRVCINTNGIVTDVLTGGAVPGGTSPIWNYQLNGRTAFRGVASDMTGKVAESAFPTCSIGGDNSTRRNISAGETGSGVEFTTITTRQLGISASIGPVFTMEAGFTTESSITASFVNKSKPAAGAGYKRILCATTASPGNFNNLTWSGTPSGVQSPTVLPAGMLISVSTRCDNDSVSYPCS